MIFCLGYDSAYKDMQPQDVMSLASNKKRRTQVQRELGTRLHIFGPATGTQVQDYT